MKRKEKKRKEKKRKEKKRKEKKRKGKKRKEKERKENKRKENRKEKKDKRGRIEETCGGFFTCKSDGDGGGAGEETASSFVGGHFFGVGVGRMRLANLLLSSKSWFVWFFHKIIFYKFKN